jgi:hypothetical protein
MDEVPAVVMCLYVLLERRCAEMGSTFCDSTEYKRLATV